MQKYINQLLKQFTLKKSSRTIVLKNQTSISEGLAQLIILVIDTKFNI